MTKVKALVAASAAVAAMGLAAPATSSAQGIDVPTLCNSLLGSGTTDVTPLVSVDRCFAAGEPQACTLTDTLNVLNLVRIRHGICIDLDILLAKRTVGVRGLATVRLLPNAVATKTGRAALRTRALRLR
jgi:hypothetical protein